MIIYMTFINLTYNNSYILDWMWNNVCTNNFPQLLEQNHLTNCVLICLFENKVWDNEKERKGWLGFPFLIRKLNFSVLTRMKKGKKIDKTGHASPSIFKTVKLIQTVTENPTTKNKLIFDASAINPSLMV